MKIEPLATARYRDRFTSSRSKSDASDARVLADAVRTDRHLHRHVDGDSEQAHAIRVLARAHQTAVWERTRQVQRLRQTLREFYPAAPDAFPDLAHRDALSMLAAASDPLHARRMSRAQIASALRRGGRQQQIHDRAAQIQTALRGDHLAAPTVVAAAYATVVTSLVEVIATLNRQLDQLADELAPRFTDHRDATILLSFPGLGDVLGARVLAEIGDDRSRFTNASALRDYAGTSPITRASGQRRGVFARHVQEPGGRPGPGAGGRDRNRHSETPSIAGPSPHYGDHPAARLLRQTARRRQDARTSAGSSRQQTHRPTPRMPPPQRRLRRVLRLEKPARTASA